MRAIFTRPAPSESALGRVSVLDGVRELSIVLVLAAHLLPLNAIWPKLNESVGVLGMALFVGLSGYLIGGLGIKRKPSTVFFVQRLSRIVPLCLRWHICPPNISSSDVTNGAGTLAWPTIQSSSVPINRLPPKQRRAALTILQTLLVASLALPALQAPAAPFGTAARPFAASSPWNARPLGAKLGSDEIPKSLYFPSLDDGRWSTGVFVASPNDPPITVLPLPGRAGIWDPDAEAQRDSIVIPRWPAGVVPASAADGHGDIVDPVEGVIHSFNVLRYVDGQWRADQYAWTPLNGRGWGDPSHYFQGARAAAVPTTGGLIRTAEIADGDSLFRHALAISLTHNGLAASPSYIFPATSSDAGAASNTGRIPEGALLMLPPDYDTASIRDPLLRKVAQTLKVHGAYVVDRNGGTPFVIYVEIGANLQLHKPRWNNEVANELDRMRAGLKQVISVDQWLDGNGQPMVMEQRLNRLSMRGPWRRVAGSRAPGRFETREQAVMFPPGDGLVTQVNEGGHNLHPVAWSPLKPGARYQLTAKTTGGGTLQVQLLNTDRRQVLFDSGELPDGKTQIFRWPEGQGGVTVTTRSGIGPGPSSVSGTLVEIDEPVAKQP